jgi:hypothetical protein
MWQVVELQDESTNMLDELDIKLLEQLVTSLLNSTTL